MTLQEIKEAVLAGETVCWANDSYEVIHDSVGQWLIYCKLNENCCGLTWTDETTMNGKPEQFYIKN